MDVEWSRLERQCKKYHGILHAERSQWELFPPEEKKKKSYVTFPKEEKINKQSPEDETSHFCLPFLQAQKKKHPRQTVGRDVAASLLKQTRYTLFLSCYLKKTITWKPLSLMTFTHVPKTKYTYENQEVSDTQTFFPKQTQSWKSRFWTWNWKGTKKQRACQEIRCCSA